MKNLKRFLLSVLLPLYGLSAQAQYHESFENLNDCSSGWPTIGCRSVPSPFNVEHFYNGCVSGWFSVFGKPFVMNMPTVNIGGTNMPCLAADGGRAAELYIKYDNWDCSYMTGSIALNRSFSAGVTYTLTYKINVRGVDYPSYNPNFQAILTNGLSNSNAKPVVPIPSGSMSVQFLGYNDLMTLWSQSTCGTNWATVSVCFTPDRDYSQIWFRPYTDNPPGTFQRTLQMEIDDIHIDKQGSGSPYTSDFQFAIGGNTGGLFNSTSSSYYVFGSPNYNSERAEHCWQLFESYSPTGPWNMINASSAAFYNFPKLTSIFNPPHFPFPPKKDGLRCSRYYKLNHLVFDPNSCGQDNPPCISVVLYASCPTLEHNCCNGVDDGGHKSNLPTLIPQSTTEMTMPFMLFPNPGNTEITISFTNPSSNNGSITVASLDGKVLATKTSTKQKETIDISELPVGVYLITVQVDGKAYPTRVVKQ